MFHRCFGENARIYGLFTIYETLKHLIPLQLSIAALNQGIYILCRVLPAICRIDIEIGQIIDGGNSFSSSLKSGVAGAFSYVGDKASSFKDNVVQGAQSIKEGFTHPIETIKNGSVPH